MLVCVMHEFLVMILDGRVCCANIRQIEVLLKEIKVLKISWILSEVIFSTCFFLIFIVLYEFHLFVKLVVQHVMIFKFILWPERMYCTVLKKCISVILIFSPYFFILAMIYYHKIMLVSQVSCTVFALVSTTLQVCNHLAAVLNTVAGRYIAYQRNVSKTVIYFCYVCEGWYWSCT